MFSICFISDVSQCKSNFDVTDLVLSFRYTVYSKFCSASLTMMQETRTPRYPTFPASGRDYTHTDSKHSYIILCQRCRKLSSNLNCITITVIHTANLNYKVDKTGSRPVEKLRMAFDVNPNSYYKPKFLLYWVVIENS